MGLLRAIISTVLCVWIYKYIMTQPEEVIKIRYIGNLLVNTDPLLVIIVVLLLFNLII